MPCALGRQRLPRAQAGGRRRHADRTLADLRVSFYRAGPHHLGRARALPVRRIVPGDGWCDAAGDRNYNRPVRHPYPASAERLWRSDGLYDLIVALDHNAPSADQGRGSAIFMHVADTGYAADRRAALPCGARIFCAC